MNDVQSFEEDDDFELALKLSLEQNNDFRSTLENFQCNDLSFKLTNYGGNNKRPNEYNEGEQSTKKFAVSTEDEDYKLALKLSQEINHPPSTSKSEDDDFLLALKLSQGNASCNEIKFDEKEDGDDFLLAMKLSQEDFVPEIIVEKPVPKPSKAVSGSSERNYNDQTISVVDPSWETIDPNPDIYALFAAFNKRFFWGKLDCVEVKWSPRMTLCAGVCSYSSRAGFCSVRLSKPLLQFRPRKDLVETLLHEMIHAFLFVTKNDRDRDGHGPRFHSHMYRINKESGSNITVYHSFHDEVKFHKTHWWRCDGPCQQKPPFFGYVKRSTNRAPSPNDFWWNDHRATCGGTFIKIKEPEGYVNKKEKKNEDKKTNKVNSLDNYFVSKTATSSNTSNATSLNASNATSSNSSDITNKTFDAKFSNLSNFPTTSFGALSNSNSSSRGKQILSLVDLKTNKNSSNSAGKMSTNSSKSPPENRWAPLPGQKNIFHFINKS